MKYYWNLVAITLFMKFSFTANRSFELPSYIIYFSIRAIELIPSGNIVETLITCGEDGYRYMKRVSRGVERGRGRGEC